VVSRCLKGRIVKSSLVCQPAPSGNQAGDDHHRTVESIWREYKATRGRETRERLILHYAPLVKVVAGAIRSGVPRHVEEAELVSCGIFGLIDAIEKFDPARGVKFETYAQPRIRGAIYDELRATDWVPRRVRAKAIAINRAQAKLESDLRRSPDDTEVALEIGVSARALDRARAEISLGGLVALDAVRGAQDPDAFRTLGGSVADRAPGPVEQFEVGETTQLLAGAVNRLADRERLVLTLYYYEAMTQADIGAALGVTESRICQILSKSLGHLRDGMASSGLAYDNSVFDAIACLA
jgi:RNA polymerase sigma factor for flagellar operon FliA